MTIANQESQHYLQIYDRPTQALVTYKKTTIVGLSLFILVLVYANTLTHVSREFFFQTNFNPENFRTLNRSGVDPIPKIIHQIFFNLSENRIEFMKKYQPYRQTWKDLNPDHLYILWNASMIDKLVNESYPEVKPIYNKYNEQWVVRADIARYLVIHNKGGVYADIDVKCKQNLNNLYEAADYKRVILNYTYNPYGVSNDFFAASRNHVFMKHVIDGLNQSDVPYLTPYMGTMFRTGPMFMLGRYLSYPFKSEIYLIPKRSAQAYVDSSDHGKSWYSIDGKIIDTVWVKIGPLKLVFAVIVIVLVVRYTKR